MDLRDKLKQDTVKALKAGDKKRVEVLRYLISLIDKKELGMPPGSIREEDMVAVVRKELKNKEESKEFFVKASREELVEQSDYEIGVVKEYLPKAVDEKEIEEMVNQAVAEMGTNFGLVMKTVMERLQGKAGGEVVSRIVKQKLEK
jgi:uncharacterized protein YqeY